MNKQGLIHFFQFFCGFRKSASNIIAEEMCRLSEIDPLKTDLFLVLTQSQIKTLEEKLNKFPLDTCSFLLEMGFPPSIVQSIIDLYCDKYNILKSIEKNPYDLLRIEGISFQKIDKMATEPAMARLFEELAKE